MDYGYVRVRRTWDFCGVECCDRQIVHAEESGSRILVPTLRRGYVYHVIECETMSIPAIDEAALAAFWAAIGVGTIVDAVDFAQPAVFDFHNHMAAHIGISSAPLEFFRHRPDAQNFAA